MESPDRDPRIYMAAERTFLAWIRTGLALMGFGFVVARFGLFLREMSQTPNSPFKSTGFSLEVGTLIVLVGVAVNIVATFQHMKMIRDLNTGIDTTGRVSTTGIVLAVLMALVGLAMAGYLVVFQP
jgi:putative membrane protein